MGHEKFRQWPANLFVSSWGWLMAKRWTEERIRQIAPNYTSRTDLSKNVRGAYRFASKIPGLLDELYGNQKFVWTEDQLRVEASKYATRSEFQRGSGGAHMACVIRFPHILSSMFERQVQDWKTERAVRLEVSKYSTRSELQACNSGCYKSAILVVDRLSAARFRADRQNGRDSALPAPQLGHLGRDIARDGQRLLESRHRGSELDAQQHLEIHAVEFAYRLFQQRAKAVLPHVELAVHIELVVDADLAVDAQDVLSRLPEIGAPRPALADQRARQHLGIDGEITGALVVKEAAVPRHVHPVAVLGDVRAAAVDADDDALLHQRAIGALHRPEAERGGRRQVRFGGKFLTRLPHAIVDRGNQGLRQLCVLRDARALGPISLQDGRQVIRVARRTLAGRYRFHDRFVLFNSSHLDTVLRFRPRAYRRARARNGVAPAAAPRDARRRVSYRPPFRQS